VVSVDLGAWKAKNVGLSWPRRWYLGTRLRDRSRVVFKLFAVALRFAFKRAVTHLIVG